MRTAAKQTNNGILALWRRGTPEATAGTPYDETQRATLYTAGNMGIAAMLRTVYLSHGFESPMVEKLTDSDFPGAATLLCAADAANIQLDVVRYADARPAEVDNMRRTLGQVTSTLLGSLVREFPARQPIKSVTSLIVPHSGSLYTPHTPSHPSDAQFRYENICIMLGIPTTG